MNVSPATFDQTLDAHLAGRIDEAERGYRAILAHDPNHAGALHLFGVLRYQRDEWDDGEALIRRAIVLEPDARYFASLADLLTRRGRLDEAEAACRQAIAIDSRCVFAHFVLGDTLAAAGRWPEAEAAYRDTLALDPTVIAAWNNLGSALSTAGRFDDAIAALHRALALDPHFIHANYNLGMALLRKSALPGAEAAFRRALETDPNHRDALNNLGTTLKLAGRFDEAEACYRRTLDVAPTFADARWNLAFLLLAQGRYAEGWPIAEVRTLPGRVAPGQLPEVAFPQWQGESLEGKSIVLWHEQGYGDTVQFARYAPLLKARGVRHLTLLCPPALKPLMETIDGVDDVIIDTAALPRHDYWAFYLSLPLHFGTTLDTIPAALPYLRALPERIERWGARLRIMPNAAQPRSLRIGLVWKGFAGNQHDATRSLPGLATLAPLWSVPGAQFVSLQKGQGEDDAAHPPPAQPILPLGSAIDDFADTAAIIAQLDLLITVDTAAAHVAGALGKPCWLMLPHDWTDWRWLIGRSDSPWYPGVMRLFRQSAARDWREVVERMAVALRAWPR